MTKRDKATVLAVGEAKRRFSELIARVARGEQILISRRGKLVLSLARPGRAHEGRAAPVGLAAVAGALGDWRELPDLVDEIYAARRRARDRAVPEIG